MKRPIKHAATALGLVGALAFGPAAQADLAEAATNPVANLVQFRLQTQQSCENY